MPNIPPIRLGTRASRLARWQAQWVAAQLANLALQVELVPIITTGDRQQDPISAIGGQGLFTKEIQRALLDGRIDLAVHSLKDLPTVEPTGLCLAAVPPRASIHDVLVCREDGSSRPNGLDTMAEAALVGTGSLRRRAQLLRVRPDLRCLEIRGNVETRLRKLDEGQCDALVLAEAGLTRLDLSERISQVLPPTIMLPPVGQGALGLETRSDDEATRAVVRQLDDPSSHAAVAAERAMLAALEGGCMAPVAAWARVEQAQLILTARVISLDGRTMLETKQTGHPEAGDELGQNAAQTLLAQGAAKLIQAARASR